MTGSQNLIATSGTACADMAEAQEQTSRRRRLVERVPRFVILLGFLAFCLGSWACAFALLALLV